MDAKDREKTAFACHRGLFHFLVMPFGLANAPSLFMMLMKIVLQGMEDFACAYLDDVIVFSRTADDHRVHLKRVFQRLREHNLKLKLTKCKFFSNKNRISWLHHRQGRCETQSRESRVDQTYARANQRQRGKKRHRHVQLLQTICPKLFTDSRPHHRPHKEVRPFPMDRGLSGSF